MSIIYLDFSHHTHTLIAFCDFVLLFIGCCFCETSMCCSVNHSGPVAIDTVHFNQVSVRTCGAEVNVIGTSYGSRGHDYSDQWCCMIHLNSGILKLDIIEK
ncbi:hypothetical protein J4Q44_G00320130 [Coregonus suidteri]|uniref:CUB domain-containing protein n=1 Tax=Coregonus suidteri TaxID=861788 RepID=A0AAN8L499_9TELE